LFIWSSVAGLFQAYSGPRNAALGALLVRYTNGTRMRQAGARANKSAVVWHPLRVAESGIWRLVTEGSNAIPVKVLCCLECSGGKENRETTGRQVQQGNGKVQFLKCTLAPKVAKNSKRTRRPKVGIWHMFTSNAKCCWLYI